MPAAILPKVINIFSNYIYKYTRTPPQAWRFYSVRIRAKTNQIKHTHDKLHKYTDIKQQHWQRKEREKEEEEVRDRDTNWNTNNKALLNLKTFAFFLVFFFFPSIGWRWEIIHDFD